MSRPIFTVIDTPGFGNNLVEEEKTIESLVDVLKDEIKYVHAFVIAFKQQDNRMTHSLRLVPFQGLENKLILVDIKHRKGF